MRIPPKASAHRGVDLLRALLSGYAAGVDPDAIADAQVLLDEVAALHDDDLGAIVDALDEMERHALTVGGYAREPGCWVDPANNERVPGSVALARLRRDHRRARQVAATGVA